MRVARVVGLVVLVVLLVAVISEPTSSAGTARAGGRALGAVGTSLGEFVSSLSIGSSATPGREDAAVYTVRPGDTLSSIAATQGVPVETLAARNDVVDPDLIRPGRRLVVR
ncbi:LysM domain-containing protein [Actinomycetospora sp. OC33-EN08]|uniref:LysM domain-containing protein n=1 Tax=Actinomycetospora aurantiaca TaxID=3129233 RepID=A0ABU8MQ86_9PSEU